MRRMATTKQLDYINGLSDAVNVNYDENEKSTLVEVNADRIDVNGVVNIGSGLIIGIETRQFKLCDKDSNTPICNANWTQLSSNFPSQFDDDGRPLFLYKINNGG